MSLRTVRDKSSRTCLPESQIAFLSRREDRVGNSSNNAGAMDGGGTSRTYVRMNKAAGHSRTPGRFGLVGVGRAQRGCVVRRAIWMRFSLTAIGLVMTNDGNRNDDGTGQCGVPYPGVAFHSFVQIAGGPLAAHGSWRGD